MNQSVRNFFFAFVGLVVGFFVGVVVSDRFDFDFAETVTDPAHALTGNSETAPEILVNPLVVLGPAEAVVRGLRTPDTTVIAGVPRLDGVVEVAVVV